MHPKEIDSDDGEVRLLNPADYETKDSYTFDVTTSDGELSDTKTVTVNITDVNEVSTITSSETGSVAENADITTVIYDADATDPDGDTSPMKSLALMHPMSRSIVMMVKLGY